MIPAQKRIFLHLGIHRTGSTRIQKWCFQNDQFLRRNGIYYTHNGIPRREFGHHFIAQHFGSFVKYSDKILMEKILTEFDESECLDFIISSEDFSLFTKQNVSDFLDFFRGYQILPIVFRRKDVEWVISSWKKVIELGLESQSLRNYARHNLYRIDMTQYKRIWGPLHKVLQFEDTDPLINFLKIFSVSDYSHKLNDFKINRSSDIKYLFVKRFFGGTFFYQPLLFLCRFHVVTAIARIWYRREYHNLMKYLKSRSL